MQRYTIWGTPPRINKRLWAHGENPDFPTRSRVRRHRVPCTAARKRTIASAGDDFIILVLRGFFSFFFYSTAAYSLAHTASLWRRGTIAQTETNRGTTTSYRKPVYTLRITHVRRTVFNKLYAVKDIAWNNKKYKRTRRTHNTRSVGTRMRRWYC